jgi:hypothetical protein
MKSTKKNYFEWYTATAADTMMTILVCARGMNFLGLIYLALVIPTSLSYTTEALNDKVTQLPGSENIASLISFNQFSGYIPRQFPPLLFSSRSQLLLVGGKMMHYYFVESMNDPTNDPIAFWTNGFSFFFFAHHPVD